MSASGETVLGFPGLSLVGSKIVEDPFRGVSWERTYEGTHEAVEEGRLSLSGTDYYREAIFGPSSPKATLIVRTPDYGDGQSDSVVVATWDLTTNHANRSAYEHPKAMAIESATIQEIRKALKRNGAQPSGLGGDAQTLWEHMTKGQDTFFSPQATFKITRVISRRANITVSYLDVLRPYSSAALIAETTPTTVYQLAIAGAYNNFPFSVPTGFTLGWLKMFPNFNNVSGGRVAVTIEYFLEAWSDFFYQD